VVLKKAGKSFAYFLKAESTVLLMYKREKLMYKREGEERVPKLFSFCSPGKLTAMYSVTRET